MISTDSYLKNLIVVQTANDLFRLNSLIDDTCDLLVFDQEVMIKLDESDVKYLSIEDVFHSTNYATSVKKFSVKLEHFLAELDATVERDIGFAFTSRGSCHYVLKWGFDFFYLDRLIYNLKSRYSKFFIFGDKVPRQSDDSILSFHEICSKNGWGTVSFPYEFNGLRIFQILSEVLNAEFIEDGLCYREPKCFLRKRFTFNIKRTGEIVRRAFRIWLRPSASTSGSALVIQSGYEVSRLEKYLPLSFDLQSINSLRSKIIEVESQAPSDPVKQKVEHFVRKNFFYIQDYVTKIITSYLAHVCPRISVFSDAAGGLFDARKPKIVFLSIGIRDVFDLICCLEAEKRGLPVVIFQHGGCVLFHYSPLQQALEYNCLVKKHLILQSPLELRKVANDWTLGLALGSIELCTASRKQTKTPNKNKGLLFCCGPESTYSFRQLINNYSARKRLRHLRSVISISSELELSCSIKLHPVGEDSDYQSVKKLLADFDTNIVSVIYGVDAERIIESYEIVVIDYLGSKIVGSILNLTIPVIIYDGDFDRLRIDAEVKKDLERRCYVAKSDGEFKALLTRHQEFGLPNKLTLDFVNKYFYSTDSVDPGQKMAEAIMELTV